MADFNKLFNKLSAREKWDTWKEQTGTWHCSECGTELSDGPRSSGPFPRSGIHCGNCDAELTRRTGGGQLDPFEWILKEKIITEIDLSNYFLSSPQKTECRCGAKVHFLAAKLCKDENRMFILCTECGQIAQLKPGGRNIISEGYDE